MLTGPLENMSSLSRREVEREVEMEIYTVEQWDYDGRYIVGLFTTLEEAAEVAKPIHDKHTELQENCAVYKYTIGEIVTEINPDPVWINGSMRE